MVHQGSTIKQEDVLKMLESQPTQKEVDSFEEKFGVRESKISFRIALKFHVPLGIWLLLLGFAIANLDNFVNLFKNYGLMVLIHTFCIQSAVETARQASIYDWEYHKARFYMLERQRRGYYEQIQEGISVSASYRVSYILILGLFTVVNAFTNWVDYTVILGYLLGFVVVLAVMSWGVHRDLNELQSYKTKLEPQTVELNDFRERVIDELTDYVRCRHGWFIETVNGNTSDAAFAMAYVYEMLNRDNVRELSETLKDALSRTDMRRNDWINDLEFQSNYVEALSNLIPLVQETAPGKYPEFKETREIVKEFLD